MVGLDDLLGLFGMQVDARPDYEPRTCLLTTHGPDTCRACVDACPHEAIELGPRIEIDAIDCTGCGICIAACPSEALSSDIKLSRESRLRCGEVDGNSQSVHCFAGMAPADYLRLAGPDGTLTLARGNCAECAIGSAAVPGIIDHTLSRASALAELTGQPFTPAITEQAELTSVPEKRVVNRRSFLTLGFDEGRGIVAGALGPFEQLMDALEPLARKYERFRPASEAERDRVPPPPEKAREYRYLLAAEPSAEVTPWVLPEVAAGCIMCPICTRVCPTDAIDRDYSNPDAPELVLQPSRCTGCNACVEACPVSVISLNPTPPTATVLAKRIVLFSSKDKNEHFGRIAR